MIKTLLAAATGAALWLSTAASAAPIRTDKGLIEGTVQDGVRAFKGLPFAAAPIGALRWRAPEPVAAWKGVRPATAFAPACPQSQVGNAAMDSPHCRPTKTAST